MRYSLLMLLVLVGSSACAMTGPNAGTKTYNAPSLTVPAVRSELFSGIYEMTRQQGWTVVASDAQASTIEAVTEADASLGVEMRERWLFVIEDYQVSVKRTLEVRFDPTSLDWQHEGTVCQGYVYLRENEVLASLEARFGGGTSIAANQPKAKLGS
jgi:hypothetical protein